MSRAVSIFGLGYVGTVTAACLAHQGNQVTGVDLNPALPQTFSMTYSPVVRPGYTAGPFTGSWDRTYSCREQFRGGTVRRRPIDLSTESGALRFSDPMKSRVPLTAPGCVKYVSH
jgi:hypothetical protein